MYLYTYILHYIHYIYFFKNFDLIDRFDVSFQIKEKLKLNV